MKQIVTILSLCCVITHFQYHYGMESKEAKPKTTPSMSSSSTTTSGTQNHKEPEEQRTPEQQNVHHFKSILRKTLERFHQSTKTVNIVVKNMQSDDPVAYDASTQTFFIDPRIADKAFLPITAEKNMWTRVPPAYRFYAYWLARQHIQTVRNGSKNYLDMLKTNLEYLLHHDKHYDAVLYAVIRSLTQIMRDKQHSDTAIPNPTEEYNAIVSYLKKYDFVLDQQLLKQPTNSMVIALSLSAPVVHKNGDKDIVPLYNTGFTIDKPSSSDYQKMHDILRSKITGPHTTPEEKQSTADNRFPRCHVLEWLISFFSGRKP